MPIFTQQPLVEKKQQAKVIPEEMIAQYIPFVQDLKKGNVGLLEFTPDEDIKLGRLALQEAGVRLKKYLKVQKVRGEDRKLKFIQVSKKEFDEARARAAARGAKLRGPRKKPQE